MSGLIKETLNGFLCLLFEFNLLPCDLLVKVYEQNLASQK